jgi:peptide/nickel transport system substrate-binding protein
MRTKAHLALSLLVLAAACQGSERESSSAGGTMIIASGQDLITLFPPASQDAQTDRQVSEMVYDYLARVGNDLNTTGDKGFVPRLASSWSWAADSLSIAFQLDPKARWHDGHPVTANDVIFTFAAYKDPSAQASAGGDMRDVDSVTAKDSSTVVFWFKQKSLGQFLNAASRMLIQPAHIYKDIPFKDIPASPAASKPIGTGQFRFAKWEPGTSMEVVADTTNYKGRPNIDRVVWSFNRDFAPLVTRLFAGEADLIEVLRPEVVNGLKSHPELKVISYPSMDNGFMIFNVRDPNDPKKPHPVLGDAGVRRALSMGIDRQTLVKSVLDTLGSTSIGPLVRAYPGADTTLPIPAFNTEGAKKLLDSLGWRDSKGTGIREKNGRRLSFSIITPSSSATRSGMAVLIQQQLKRIGADVKIESLDGKALMPRVFGAHKFDAVMMALTLDGAYSSLRQVYGTDGQINAGGYSNPKFDAQFDSAMAFTNIDAAKPHLKAAFETLMADAPVVWLYELKAGVVTHKRFRPAGVRPDAWWTNVADWSIPKSERNDRDKIGLTAVNR